MNTELEQVGLSSDLLGYLDSSPFYAGITAESMEQRREFINRFRYLPESLRTFLLSMETTEGISRISREFSFTRNQTIIFSLVIRNLVLGNIYIGDILYILSSNLEVDEQKARNIGSKLLNQVMQGVLPEIKQIQAQKFKDRIQGTATPRPVPGADLPETGGNIINLRDQP